MKFLIWESVLWKLAFWIHVVQTQNSLITSRWYLYFQWRWVRAAIKECKNSKAMKHVAINSWRISWLSLLSPYPCKSRKTYFEQNSLRCHLGFSTNRLLEPEKTTPQNPWHYRIYLSSVRYGGSPHLPEGHPKHIRRDTVLLRITHFIEGFLIIEVVLGDFEDHFWFGNLYHFQNVEEQSRTRTRYLQ